MTDKNYTHISVLIDESGSMGNLAADTRGGFNSFLKDQQAVGGKATMTVCTFSNGYKILSSMRDINSVEPLTGTSYCPGGGTALLDAMGKCITELGSALAALPDEKRPGKILFLVITDGEENSSREWNKAKIAEMVKRQESEYKWNFLYLGANVDAFAESANMGIRAANAIGYNATSKGIHDAYHVVSRSLGAVRGCAAPGMSYDVFSSSHVDELQNTDFTEKFKHLSVDVSNIGVDSATSNKKDVPDPKV